MIPNLRARSIGLSAGSTWLIAVGGGFLAASLFAIGPSAMPSAFAWVTILGACLIAGTIVIRKAWLLPADSNSDPSARKNLRRRFLIVVALEIAAFAIVNPIAAQTGHYAMLPALDLIIIGLHFFPLASIFQVPRYHLMGFLFCAISLATLIALPKTELIGQAL